MGYMEVVPSEQMRYPTEPRVDAYDGACACLADPLSMRTALWKGPIRALFRSSTMILEMLDAMSGEYPLAVLPPSAGVPPVGAGTIVAGRDQPPGGDTAWRPVDFHHTSPVGLQNKLVQPETI